MCKYATDMQAEYCLTFRCLEALEHADWFHGLGQEDFDLKHIQV